MTVVAKGELTVVHQKMHRLSRNACDAESNKNNCSTNSMSITFPYANRINYIPFHLETKIEEPLCHPALLHGTLSSILSQKLL